MLKIKVNSMTQYESKNEKVAQIVREFFSTYPLKNWPKQHTIIHAGDNPSGIYYIEIGGIRQYTIDNRGEEIVVNTYKPGAFIPMFWAFSNEPCKYFFDTTEETSLRKAPIDDVIQFLRTNPDVTFDLLARMYAGLDGVLSRMVHLMSGSAYARLLNELVIQTKRLHSPKTTNITLPFKEYQLGSFCGLSRETVSREFKKLKAKKLVSISAAGITVHDLQLLDDELKLLNEL